MFNDTAHAMLQDQYEAKLRAAQQKVLDANKQIRSALNVDLRAYVMKHGSLDLDFTIPLGVFQFNLGVSLSSNGIKDFVGFGVGYGAGYDVGGGAGYSGGHEPVGITEKFYAMGSLYKRLGGNISLYHSQNGWGWSSQAAYVKGGAVGGLFGYTTHNFWL